MKEALLCLFNGCKDNQRIPYFMSYSNITSLYKKKGSRLLLENDRGIFIQNVFKKILDKLIYSENVESIDANMSDSNIGARKGRNIKDHLFILYAVINSVVRGEEDSIDVQVYDIQKAFDALWLDDCFNDLFDSLPTEKRNDKISLLYETNVRNLIAVNTPAGLTERVDMPKIIQQGGVWGSLLCSNSIDSIGRKCKLSGNYAYKYKNMVEVLPLGFVDDLNGIAKCGPESLHLNIFLNTHVEMKKLTFHTSTLSSASKCQKMHVGKNRSNCPNLKVHGNDMSEVSEITYLGDVVSADGRNFKNIQERSKKGMGIICQVIKILKTVFFGSKRIEIALLLRESIFVNAILTNSEIWHNLSKSETDELEKVDRFLLCKILEVPGTVPHTALYLELGILQLSVVIKVRRLMYLQSILKGSNDGMLFKVFKTQWYYPVKGDWTDLVKNDLENFDYNLDEIKLMSRDQFKKIVKERARNYAFQSLHRKKANYKKLENLFYVELKTQEYLLNEDYTFEEKKLIFQFRTRMAQFEENFRAGRTETVCPLCLSHSDSQFLILSCPIIRKELLKNKEVEVQSIEDIFYEKVSRNTINILKLATAMRSIKKKL